MPLPSDTINALVVSGSSMFIGTPNGLAVRINNTWRTFNMSNSNIPSNDIGELALHNNDLWIGTKQGHICRIDTTQIINSLNDISNTPGNINVNINSDNIQIFLNSRIEGLFFLYDLNGKIIAKKIINNQENIISTREFINGVYLYELIDKNGNLLKRDKLIIHKL